MTTIYLLAATTGCALLLFLYGLHLLIAAQRSPLALFLEEDQRGAKVKKRTARKGLKQQFFVTAQRYTLLVQRYPTLRTLLAPVDLHQRLARAGHPMSLQVDTFIGVQLATMGLVALGALYVSLLLWGLSPTTLLLSLVVGTVGAPLATLLLGQEGKKRQQQLTLALPDAIELISTMVTAGLDIERAIKQVVENSSGPLAEELERFLNELRLGTPRTDAYQNLLWRNNAAELHTFVGALLQGQNLGVPIDKTLYEQTEVMRERRLQRAQEIGAQAAPKIALVTTLMIAPSIFVLFMIIMGYKLVQDFGGLFNAFGG